MPESVNKLEVPETGYIDGMAMDVTFQLLRSVLRSTVTLDLFQKIATSRIAEKSILTSAYPNADQGLDALKEADLIDTPPNGERYFVTAKGLKVARDLEKIPA